MKTKVQYTIQVLSTAVLLSAGMLFGCGRSEIENGLTPDSGGSHDIGDGRTVALRITVQDIPPFNTVDGSGAPSTRGSAGSAGSGKSLLDEMVKVNSFSMIPVKEDGGLNMAHLTLTEDTVTTSPQTRQAGANSGFRFRLIAFLKSARGYVFHSAADYEANGAAAPTLVQGDNIVLSYGQTYRFVAYTRGTEADLGVLPIACKWNETAIDIPDLNDEFLTYDGGDMVAVGEEIFPLTISFRHMLSKMKLVIEGIGMGSDTPFSDCTDVYYTPGGKSTTWKVGAPDVTPDMTTPSAAIPTIGDGVQGYSVCLLPYTEARPLTVHFGTLTVCEKQISNVTITSTQGVKLEPGKEYTMTARFLYSTKALCTFPKRESVTTRLFNEAGQVVYQRTEQGFMNVYDSNHIQATNHDRLGVTTLPESIAQPYYAVDIDYEQTVDPWVGGQWYKKWKASIKCRVCGAIVYSFEWKTYDLTTAWLDVISTGPPVTWDWEIQ